ncbi:abortive infection family protein [Aedoeadaptatus acetigenes]|uniref:abortive infection family protein n=1 Tax=Aedoeadaptatus acetigenes TaxID=2981723 RepID=UPI002265B657|nr:abortive infection family protein [Aedoeadaptatus acetigenes]MCU6786271.1 abortive infection family protein [Aedoeadaptatus acetigenes]
MPKEKSKFELLREKSILSILDGDEDFGTLEVNGTDSGIKISMPYLSGPTLCDISNKFGLPVTYGWNGGAQSRWAYLDDLLAHCIQNKRESDLLAFLFSKGQFVDKLRGQTPEVIEYAYAQIVNAVIGQINGALYFGGNELVQVGKVFVIRKLGSTVSVATPSVKTIDRSYITDLSDRAMKDVIDGNYDSAITKSRTLLEEVFCYVIEKKGEDPSESGDIGKLYNQVKQLYNMHQSKDMDKRINGLLSGLEKILSAIAEMRNKGSDSHGVGAKRISIADHHARLFVNSAMTMADFVLAVSEKASR